MYGYRDISRCLLGAETDIGVRPIYGRLSDNLDSSTHKIECDRKLKEEKIHIGEKQRRGGRGGGDLTFRGTHRHLLHVRRYRRGVAFRRDSTFTSSSAPYHVSFSTRDASRINHNV